MNQIVELLKLDGDLKKLRIDSEEKYKLISSDKRLVDEWTIQKNRIVMMTSNLSPVCRDYVLKIISESEVYFKNQKKDEGFLNKYGGYILAFALGFIARDSLSSLGKNFSDTLIRTIYETPINSST